MRGGFSMNATAWQNLELLVSKKKIHENPLRLYDSGNHIPQKKNKNGGMTSFK